MTARSTESVAAVTPRAAATTLIVRDAHDGLEVLMVRRSLQASFMPGAYVFPGGAVDAADAWPAAQALCDERSEDLANRIGSVTEVGDQAQAFAVAALRECFEECGLWLGVDEPLPTSVGGLPKLRARLHAGESIAGLAEAAGLLLHTRGLHPWSHWVTPVGLPKRFDTLFFVVRAPAGQVAEVDAGETTTLAWVNPDTALQAHSRGEFPMEFATVSTVQSLQSFARGRVATLLAHAADLRHLPPLHPRLKLDGEGRIKGVLLPGQPGYDQAA